MFDWKPWDRTNVLLKDFGDYGNAAARSSPNNAVLLDVAPLRISMETFTPGERFFTLTNHELAHVATMDVWNKRDAFWRELPARQADADPGTSRNRSCAIISPRRATMCRAGIWRARAVFFETWMAGGLGRAQGAYDEMVFRAKVRDDDKFYSPLGLESEGIAVDFQVGVNDYLYGTRFFSYLALNYGPTRWSNGFAAARTARPITRRSSNRSSAASSTTPGTTGSRSSTNSRRPIWRACRNIR